MLTLSDLIYWPCEGSWFGSRGTISMRCLLILITCRRSVHTRSHSLITCTEKKKKSRYVGSLRTPNSATHAHKHRTQTKSFFLTASNQRDGVSHCASLWAWPKFIAPLTHLECLACHRTFIINSCCFNINKYMKSFSQLLGNSLFIAAVMIY